VERSPGDGGEVELDSAPLLEPLGYHDRLAEFTRSTLVFRRPSGTRNHNLHIVAKGTASLRNEILFRDRMRRNHEAVRLGIR
jgi:GrpB-like predicted nucleotidyltransferase (UPF0157 family)